MSAPLSSNLHPSLRAFPGVVLELSPDGMVLGSNGRTAPAGENLIGRAFAEVLDDPSVAKLRRLLEQGPTEAPIPRIELNFEVGETVETRSFCPSWELEQGRLWLVEQFRESQVETLHGELYGVNTELVNTQRELAKKSGRLSRLVEEVERKLEENERLSQILQYQNVEMEAQNEELLAMTEELHAGQEALMQVNHQLEVRSRELQLALSARNRFYAAMSHELRTPINAVMGYNDLLLAGVYGLLNEQQELAVERSQRAARHLRELVNDVLDISKIELGRMEVVIEEIAIGDLIESLFITLGPIAESQGSRLHFSSGDCPMTVRTDRRCVRQILLNLITQSVKLGGGNPVFVQCVPPPDRDGIVIEITDGGGGMSTDELAGVFEEFTSVGEVNVDSPMLGTGLGLPVAHRLAALIGGRLDVSTTPGLGNVFRLFLPSGPQLPPPTVA